MAPSLLKDQASGLVSGPVIGEDKETVGYDAVESLLQEARRLYPNINFKKAFTFASRPRVS
jgi:hypothetical protein